MQEQTNTEVVVFFISQSVDKNSTWWTPFSFPLGLTVLCCLCWAALSCSSLLLSSSSRLLNSSSLRRSSPSRRRSSSSRRRSSWNYPFNWKNLVYFLRNMGFYCILLDAANVVSQEQKFDKGIFCLHVLSFWVPPHVVSIQLRFAFGLFLLDRLRSDSTASAVHSYGVRGLSSTLWSSLESFGWALNAWTFYPNRFAKLYPIQFLFSYFRYRKEFTIDTPIFLFFLPQLVSSVPSSQLYSLLHMSRLSIHFPFPQVNSCAPQPFPFLPLFLSFPFWFPDRTDGSSLLPDSQFVSSLPSPETSNCKWYEWVKFEYSTLFFRNRFPKFHTAIINSIAQFIVMEALDFGQVWASKNRLSLIFHNKISNLNSWSVHSKSLFDKVTAGWAAEIKMNAFGKDSFLLKRKRSYHFIKCKSGEKNWVKKESSSATWSLWRIMTLNDCDLFVIWMKTWIVTNVGAFVQCWYIEWRVQMRQTRQKRVQKRGHLSMEQRDAWMSPMCSNSYGILALPHNTLKTCKWHLWDSL